jgi:diacylglycerol kinase (ATP)
MAIAVVANPESGRGKGTRLIPQVDALLRSLGLEHRMHVSQDPSDPERLARQAAAEGVEIVAALGGDGHVGACANGLVGTQTALAVIPAGAGNDFARHIGLNRKDPLAAARMLASPTIAKVDVAQARTTERERYYVNVAGVGFDSEVNAHANRVRFIQGTLKYVFSTFVTLARFKAGRFSVCVDDKEHTLPGMLIAVANASSYGGGMLVCPEARLDDGKLDVCVIGEIPKWDFVRTFPKVFKGRHIDHPKVHMLRGQQIEVSAERPFQVFADGELVGPIPATFTVVAGALSVVVPDRDSLSRP